MPGYTDRGGFRHEHEPKDRSAFKRCPACKAAKAAEDGAWAAEKAARAAKAASFEAVRAAPAIIVDSCRPVEPCRRFELEGRSFAVLETLPGMFNLACFDGRSWERASDLLTDFAASADLAAVRYLHPVEYEGD